MIEELYIDGNLIDIEDVGIVRKYTTPFFSDVQTWINNSTYTVKIPLTTNNKAFFELCFREDMTSDIPYDVHYADYYVNGFPVFEQAETKFIGTESGYIEVQFVWGIAREKYLSLFNGYLNEIPFDGVNVIEDDWVSVWNKTNVENPSYTTGKSFKYLDYISGEVETDAVIIDGIPVAIAEVPNPYRDSRKAMTQHPFVAFNNILDLIISATAIEISKTVSSITKLNVINVTNVTGLKVGMLLKSIGSSGVVTSLNIRIAEIISDTQIRLNQDSPALGTPIVFIDTNIGATEFDPLKAKLTNMGLILGGNKGNKSFTYTENYGLNIDVDTGDRLPLTNYVSSFSVLGTPTNKFWLSPYVNGGDIDEITITPDIGITNEGVIGLFSSDRAGGSVTLVKYLPYSVSGTTHIYNTAISFKPEKGLLYFFKLEGLTSPGVILSGSSLIIKHDVTTALYSMNITEDEVVGHYNCILNLPEITPAEFIQQMLIISGLSVGWDANGDIRFFDLQNFADNLDSSDVMDWSGLVSEPMKGEFQFNSNAQLNVIKYSNSDKLKYISEDYLTVIDNTIDKRRDLYTLMFDLPEGSPYSPEFILYKQRVSSVTSGASILDRFTNTYTEKPSVAVYDVSGFAKGYGVAPNSFLRQGFVYQGFVYNNYPIYQQIIKRPLVRELEVDLEFLKTIAIDFEKPVYIEEFGKYCLLLDIQVPNNEPCVAKLLLITRDL